MAWFSVFVLTGPGLAFAVSPFSYIGRLRQLLHAPVPLRGFAGSKLSHCQTRKPTPMGSAFCLIVGASYPLLYATPVDVVLAA
jgi:hypothetical protein